MKVFAPSSKTSWNSIALPFADIQQTSRCLLSGHRLSRPFRWESALGPLRSSLAQSATRVIPEPELRRSRRVCAASVRDAATCRPDFACYLAESSRGRERRLQEPPRELVELSKKSVLSLWASGKRPCPVRRRQLLDDRVGEDPIKRRFVRGRRVVLCKPR